MANRNSPQSPPLQDQVPNQLRIGIEIPLDPDMLEPELIPSPVAGDDGSNKFLGIFYRVDVEALEEWAKVKILWWAVLISSLKSHKLLQIFEIFFW